MCISGELHHADTYHEILLVGVRRFKFFQQASFNAIAINSFRSQVCKVRGDAAVVH